jgi:hypothetical protein
MVYFQAKIPKFGYILEGLAMEDVGIFYGQFVYFTDKWYILWPSGSFFGQLVYCFPFWYVVLRKVWQPWFEEINTLFALAAWSCSIVSACHRGDWGCYGS